MSYCRICGDENNVKYHSGKGMMCQSCANDTPVKVSREEFDKVYWQGDTEANEAIKREFYDDYRASRHTLREYIKATTSQV